MSSYGLRELHSKAFTIMAVAEVQDCRACLDYQLFPMRECIACSSVWYIVKKFSNRVVIASIRYTLSSATSYSRCVSIPVIILVHRVPICLCSQCFSQASSAPIHVSTCLHCTACVTNACCMVSTLCVRTGAGRAHRPRAARAAGPPCTSYLLCTQQGWQHAHHWLKGPVDQGE